jgi:hypothetical protein
MTPGPAQPQQKWVPENFPGGGGAKGRQADNLAPICEPIV